MGKGAWIKLRRPMSKYPRTPQQVTVAVGGQMIREACTGRKGTDFLACRREVLQCAFDDEECDAALRAMKDRIQEDM